MIPMPVYSGAPVRIYNLDVVIDVENSVIHGTAGIAVNGGEQLQFRMGRLTIVRASLDEVGLPISNGGESVGITPPKTGVLEIRYEGSFREADEGRSDTVIGPLGIFLTGPWYSRLDEPCAYSLRVSLPQGYEAVSEGESIQKTVKDGRTIFTYLFPRPLSGLTLMASNRYVVARERFQGVDIDSYLSSTCLEKAKRYIKLCSDLLGPFPYERFSIVENFLPTGYSMPTYTALGRQGVRLLFIPDTSLGHEILHQWLGNLVCIDYEKGNWAEGLTTFLADHLYQEEKGQSWQYRRGLLGDCMSYVNDKNEFPLKEFTERTDS
jgi:aminopeptidase N